MVITFRIYLNMLYFDSKKLKYVLYINYYLNKKLLSRIKDFIFYFIICLLKKYKNIIFNIFMRLDRHRLLEAIESGVRYALELDVEDIIIMKNKLILIKIKLNQKLIKTFFKKKFRQHLIIRDFFHLLKMRLGNLI